MSPWAAATKESSGLHASSTAKMPSSSTSWHGEVQKQPHCIGDLYEDDDSTVEVPQVHELNHATTAGRVVRHLHYTIGREEGVLTLHHDCRQCTHQGRVYEGATVVLLSARAFTMGVSSTCASPSWPCVGLACRRSAECVCCVKPLPFSHRVHTCHVCPSPPAAARTLCKIAENT